MQLAMRFIATSCGTKATSRERRTGGQTGQTGSAMVTGRSRKRLVTVTSLFPSLSSLPHLTRRAEKHFRFHTQIGRFKTRQIFQCLFTICSSIHSKFAGKQEREERGESAWDSCVLSPHNKHIAYTPRLTQVKLINCIAINNAKRLVAGNKLLSSHLKFTPTHTRTHSHSGHCKCRSRMKSEW